MPRWPLLRALLLFVMLLAPFRTGVAVAAPGDENWDSSFGVPGSNGTVLASTLFAGDLVIGGSFTAVGGVAVSHLARQQGGVWSAMGAPFAGDVHALYVWNSELYAGGDFPGGLARWDGTQWVIVGQGVDGSVSCLTSYASALVVGGSFEFVNGGATAANGIASWNGTSWGAMAGGVNGSVADVEVFSGSLYACGSFDIAGSVAAKNLARWNGTAWFAVGGGLTDAAGDPYEAWGNALVVSGTRLYVGGSFLKAGALVVDGVVAWTGSAFAALGTPSFGGEARALGTFGADVVAGDYYGNIKRWNGSFWSSLGFTTTGFLATFVEQAGTLVAGGGFGTIGSTSLSNVARYNGGTWSSVASGQGLSGTVECAYDWNGLTIVGGRFASAGAAPGVVAGWNGTSWQALGTGIPRSTGNFVTTAVAFGSDLVVGGFFSTAGGVAVNNIARWNGSAWSAMGSGSIANEVSGLGVVGGVLYAAGRFGGKTTLGRWNGTDFDALGTTGIAGGVQILNGTGEWQGSPLLFGGFTSVSGVTVNNIARWNGTAWQALGTGTNNAVYAAVEWNGALYVAGTFTTAGGVPASRVAKWDGANWQALGLGVNQRVFDLAVIGGDLYAIGEFTSAGGSPANRVARWDGTAWHALGSGLDAIGHSLGTQAGKLWVGGEFLVAGTTGSSRIARWTPPITTDVPASGPRSARVALRPAFPNPFTGITTIAFELPRAGEVSVAVFDLRGGRVRAWDRHALTAGAHRVEWDGRDAAGAEVGPGVYFAEVRSGGAAVRQRIVRVR